jgi:hypothetical protein
VSSKPSLTDQRQPRPAEDVAQRIVRLVQAQLAGRRIEGVAFVDELLAIAEQEGEVRCSPAEDHGLRFEVRGREPFEVDLDANRGKLRMLCARLAVLCQESGSDFMPYGGEGKIRRVNKLDSTDGAMSPCSITVKANWTNTPGKHEFVIQAD